MAETTKTSYSSLKNNLSNDDGSCEERKTLLYDDSDDDEEAIFLADNSHDVSPSKSLDNNAPDKLERVRSEVRKVTDVMLENVQKVMDRGRRLDDLESASDRLVLAGAEFESSSRKARYNGWMQNLVAKYAAVAILLSVVAIVLVTTIVKYS